LVRSMQSPPAPPPGTPPPPATPPPPPPPAPPPAPPRFGISELYDQLKTNSDQGGRLKKGVLVHMFSMNDANDLLQGSGEIRANSPIITDCGNSQTRSGSCSAWSYLREDLMPIVYNMPSSTWGPKVGNSSVNGDPTSNGREAKYATLTLGIIIDPDKVQDMITGLSLTDSDTNDRINCAVGSRGPQDELIAVTQQGLQSPQYGYLGGNFQGYEAPSAAGCSSIQDADEKARCKAINAGGGINYQGISCVGRPEHCWKTPSGMPDWNSVACDWGNKACSGYKKDNKYWPETGCDLCTYSFFCELSDEVPEGSEEILNAPQSWGKYFVDTKKKNAGVCIGPDGSGILKAYAAEEDGKMRPRNLWDSILLSCRFRPEHFDVWIKQLKAYYKIWLDSYTQDGNFVQAAQPFYGYDPYCKNFLLAVPQSATYLETEVNLYMEPPQGDKKEQETQDELFRSAVLGFFTLGKTCEESMNPLSASPGEWAWLYAPDATHSKVSNALDRCQGFMCADETATDAERATCSETLITGEKDILDYSASLAGILAEHFNTKYRTSPKDTQIQAFTFSGGSLTFYDYKNLKALNDNGRLPGSSYFVEIQEPHPSTTLKTLNSLNEKTKSLISKERFQKMIAPRGWRQ
jgi:hypothetical protein